MPAVSEEDPIYSLVLKYCNMETQIDMFVSQWNEKFPGVAAPDLRFNGVEDIEQRLSTCKSVIKSLEDRLNQERFHLIFLQTFLAGQKKSYTRERWGFNRAESSSFDSENDPQSPLVDGVSDKTRIVFENGTGKPVDSLPVNNVANGVKLRPPVAEKTSHLNRQSKVLANVKLFESKAEDVSPEQATDPQRTGSFHKSSFRKRDPYLQVWECKTGADDEQILNEDKSDTIAQLDNAAVAMAARVKPPVAQRGSRKDYVEVWRCNTGDHVSRGIVYDDQSDFSAMPIETDPNESQDYDVEDIDMKDGYGKKHYTIAGSDVKLRAVDDPSNSRLTWPAAVAPFQDNALQSEADNIDGFSANIDLSDLDNDHLSDSPPSDSSHEEVEDAPLSYDSLTSLPHPDSSPLLRIRRAQTTNERMSAAYAALSHWSDDDKPTRDRSSMISVPSVDHLSSDEEDYKTDEGPASGDDSLAPTPPLKAENNFVFSKPKADDTESTATDGSLQSNRKPVKTPLGEKLSGPRQNETVSDMVDYQKVRSIAEAEKLRMRKWVLSLLLDTEEQYLQYLNTLLLYMKPLKATIGTSQPVMSAQDFDTLFYRVPELHNLHADFYAQLKPRLDNWSADTNVGDLFKKLLNKLNLYSDYLNNYKRAQHTVEKCAKENAQFAQIIESLKVQQRGSKNSESISLIDVLYKPVERVMRTTLVLQDLLKHTPHRHPDYQILRQVLKQSQIFLDRINSSSSSYKPKRVPSSAVAASRLAERELIKDGFLVEVASDMSRKLRHCFLYSDLLLCAKQKNAASVFHSKDSYECKWYIPLADLSFQPKEDSEVFPEMASTSDDELREMSNNAQQLKRDIVKERKRIAKQQKSSESSPARSRKEERLRKKLAELEARIVLAAPDLPLRIYHMQGKSYMFLMSSDYERTEWTEAIMKQQETCFKSFNLTSYEINTLLTTCVKNRKVNNIGSMLMKEDEELLSGYLNVTIHSGCGFLSACNPYCTLEVDSYGQFQTKAKTRPCKDTKFPEWNEEFELDLDGAMTLRILCYDRAREAAAGASYDDDVLIAKGKVGLIQESLKGNGEWIEESVLMNELTIRVSVKFTARERSLQRLPSKKSTGVFGVKISQTAKRDSSGIPSIVRKCIDEVERRGMNEVGIYRVSGVASEIQALKASFDADRKDVNVLLGEVDINAVAGVLKLYFRELPEPLYTDEKYSAFLEASSLTDPETKHLTITRLLNDLPAVNYKTLHFLRNHLIKVARNEAVNKMSMHNLATVFGPTLVRPAEEKTAKVGQSLTMLNALQLDVHYQMDVLLHCLEMKEMVDYETMKNGKKEKTEQVPLSSSVDNSNTDHSGETIDNDQPKKTRRPIVRASTVESRKSIGNLAKEVVPPPALSQQRFHPYEEIYIPPKVNAKPQIVKPTVARKPSVEPNGRGAGKPTPAPRRPQSTKQSPLPIMTDL